MPEHLDVFQTGYGPDGDWVRLFRRDSNYVETHLLRDCDRPTRFLTIDVWTSREAFVAFRERFRQEFDELDAFFAGYTASENHLGDFDGFGERGFR